MHHCDFLAGNIVTVMSNYQYNSVVCLTSSETVGLDVNEGGRNLDL